VNRRSGGGEGRRRQAESDKGRRGGGVDAESGEGERERGRRWGAGEGNREESEEVQPFGAAGGRFRKGALRGCL